MINGVFSQSMFAVQQYGGGQASPQLTTQQSSSSQGADKVSLHQSHSVENIAQRYDVRNITPQKMSELSQGLYESGAISFQDHALMSFQPELGADPIPGVNASSKADVPKDFIQHWEQQLEYHEQQRNDNFAKNAQRVLNILNNIAEITGPSKA